MLSKIKETIENIILIPLRRRIKGTQSRFEMLYRFIDTDDFPEHVNDQTVYVVGEANKWVAVLRCPCGCNDIIQLNLLPDSTPSWSVRKDRKGRRYLSPSINRLVNCRSHFNITRGGKIKWWGDPE